MEILQGLIDTMLESNVLLYLGLIADGIMSIFLCKKCRKKSSSSTPASEDLSALIAYHENCAKKLREKFDIKE